MAGTSISFDIIARDMASAKLGKVGRAADQSAGPIGRLGRQMGSIAKTYGPLAAAAAGAFAVKFGVEAVNAASEAQQSIGATETVFKEFADTVIKESETAAEKFGLSANEYRENANLIGSLFKNQGVELDELAEKTDDMIGVAADLAATFGGDTKTAVEALGSAFKGEFDPLEKYGISLKQSAINADAAKLAQERYGKSLDDLSPKQQDALKQQATVEQLMRQSADSAGQFARESDTLAGKQQRLKAKFDDLKVALGDKLLPIAEDFTDWLMTDGIPLAERFVEKMGDFKPVIDAWNAGLEDAQPLLDLFSDSTDDTSNSIKVLDAAFASIKGPLAVTSASLRWMGKVLGAVGEAGRRMWNGMLAPAFRAISNGVADLASGFADMFRAMGKVPGFGWANKAADAMDGAADKARELAAGIRDIPSNKTITITTFYKSIGAPRPEKGGPGQGAGVLLPRGGGSGGRSVAGRSPRSLGVSPRMSSGVTAEDIRAALEGMAITIVDGDAGRRAFMAVPGAI